MRSALAKIQQWAASINDSISDPPHHQLVIDLDRCVQCCSLLLAKLDAEILLVCQSRKYARYHEQVEAGFQRQGLARRAKDD